MELHDHSHSRSTCWDDDLFTIVMMITQWSISGVIQLGIHFSTLRCHRVPLYERCILAWWAWHCYGFVWSGLHICWCMIGRHLIFPTSHIWCHTGAYFLFRSGFAVSHLFVWLSLVTRYVSGWWFRFHFIVTLQGAFPWVISSGSYSPMSLWFLDGIISGSWTLTSSFRQRMCQVCDASPLSYSWVIRTDRIHLMPYWGIFPSFGYGDDRSLIGLLRFSLLGREILYMLYWSLLLWFSSRWVFGGTGCSGCDCLTICDSSVDCCIEITWVTLSDHFFWDSLVDHSIWSSQLTSRASFETNGVSFRPFRWIESYVTRYTRAHFPPPPSFPCSSTFRDFVSS